MSPKLPLGKSRVFVNRQSRLHNALALCTALAPMSHSWGELRELAYGYIDEAVDELEGADGTLTYNMLRDVSMLAAKAEEEGQEALAAIFSVVSSAIANEDTGGLYPHVARYVETDLPYGLRKTLAEQTEAE
ncbi:MAG TPA: hypothetical protein VMW62_14010 [Chloroflexota bacterium]|nr:hypothetical protein [Chloroflexota bacterium]